MVKSTNRKRLTAVSLATLAVICLALGLIFMKSQTGAEAASVDDNYYFKNISVDITVHRDKTFDVTETLLTRFIDSGINTGIIRDIQHESKTTRIIDGKTCEGSRYFAGLDNVSVTLDGGEAKVTRSFYGAFHSIMMQKPDGYMTGGDHIFVLKYTYDMGDDKIKGFDDFTFDVLGYRMARTGGFEANITFPEGTDLSNVTFRTNDKAAWEPDNSHLEVATVTGNAIYMRAMPMAANKGYTVQVILPEGYFTNSVTFYWYYIIFMLLALLGIAACVAIIVAGTMNKKVLAPVEYMPPEDVDIMHFSAVWHKGARYKDIGALVLQWAAKGLITIEKDGKRDLILICDERLKIKEQRDELLKGMTRREKDLFAAMMFNAGSSSTFSTKEFKKRLKSSKRYTYECSEKLVDSGNKPKPYKVSGKALAFTLPFVALIPTLAVVLYFCVVQNLYFPLFFLLFYAAGTFVGLAFRESKIILMLVFPAAFYGGLYFVFAYIFAMSVYDYAGLLIIAPIWWALCLFLFPRFLKGIRSPKVMETYTKLKGFKDFLLLTELSRIQLVFDKHPEYFSEILPYCYIMGISKKVRKRFASLDFIQPAYMLAGLDPDQIGRSTSHSCCHHSSYSVMGGGGGSGGGSGGGGGGGGSSGGGGGGGGSRGC